MTSAYRINYQLRAHKRDPLIEFIKSLLLTPFILHAKPRKPVLTSPVVNSNDQGSFHGAGGNGNGPNGSEEDKYDYQEEDRPMVDSNLQRYLEIMRSVEAMVEEHRRKAAKGVPEHSRLHRIVPSVASFFTSLPLEAAFLDANAKNSIAARRFVPPSFNDIRRLLNTAQVMAIAKTISLITFDGDMTLYDDGTCFTDSSPLIPLLITLMRAGLRVAIVTAAGYPGDASKYEDRIQGLLRGFQKRNLSEPLLERFYVLGGECNYLFRCGWKKSDSGESVVGLTYIPPESYQPAAMLAWKPEEIQELLDVAEENLKRCVASMNLKAVILRKSRAVGIVPTDNCKIAREQLDECVLSTQQRLLEYQQMSGPNKTAIPFCAFNGGNDVFVDIGNKLIGVEVLQTYLGAAPDATLHVGDQFLSTGNDFATRSSCCTLWIINPEETENVLKELTPLLTIPEGSESQHYPDHTLTSSSAIDSNHPPHPQRLHNRALDDVESTSQEATGPDAKSFIGPEKEDKATVITKARAKPTRFFSAYESIVNSESQLPVFLNQPQRKNQRRRVPQKAPRKPTAQSDTETKVASVMTSTSTENQAEGRLVSKEEGHGPSLGYEGARANHDSRRSPGSASDSLKGGHDDTTEVETGFSDSESNPSIDSNQEDSGHVGKPQRTLKVAVHGNELGKGLLEEYSSDPAELLHRRFFDDDGNFEVDGEGDYRPMLPMDETLHQSTAPEITDPLEETHNHPSTLEEATLFKDLTKEEPKVIFINDEAYIVEEPEPSPERLAAEVDRDHPSLSTYEPHNGHRGHRHDQDDSTNSFLPPFFHRQSSSSFSFNWKWPSGFLPKSLSPTEVAIVSCGVVFVGLLVLVLVVSYRLYLRRWQKSQNYYHIAYNTPHPDEPSSLPSKSEKPMGFVKYLATTLSPFSRSPFSKKVPFAGGTSPMVFVPAQRKGPMVGSAVAPTTAPATGPNAPKTTAASSSCSVSTKNPSANGTNGTEGLTASQLRRTSSSHHHQNQLEQLVQIQQQYQQHPMSP
ncbi:IMP 5'-nucleotidase [Lunasporangiospora selenospora]|uniref:IMP-specific 5'-nucleotidase 1 n=1 Tax=Lunasporangiospora selenospora TaxID=979761 RepID=A0A9P6G196_9FUNG|nr:IMP 5'-nucleotidase [Lunasporangiospora selenospora]